MGALAKRPIKQTIRFPRSTAIVYAVYDCRVGSLRLVFTSGNVADFRNVPEHVFEGLKSAPSAGSYFNTQIRGRYPAG